MDKQSINKDMLARIGGAFLEISPVEEIAPASCSTRSLSVRLWNSKNV
jgi:hypothetical protein